MAPDDPTIFADSDFSLHPQERDIDRILRASITAGASQVLIRSHAPLALKIGTAFIRPGAHGLAGEFVEKLLGEILTVEERARLVPDAEIEVEIGVAPFAACPASVFLTGGEPSVLIRLPGTELLREEPPEAPSPEELRYPPPTLTVEGCRREIRRCVEECATLHDRRVAGAAAARCAKPDVGVDSKEVRLDTLKWLESRRRSRRLIDRLRAVVSTTEQESSLEMVRAILREASEILQGLKDLAPPLAEREPHSVAAPAGDSGPIDDRGFPTTGYPLLNAGFVLGAAELLLFEGEIPTYFIRGEPKRPGSQPVSRKELEALLGAWRSGPEFQAGVDPASEAFHLKFGNGDAVRVEVRRDAPTIGVTVNFNPGHPAPVARPFLRALPPESHTQNAPSAG